MTTFKKITLSLSVLLITIPLMTWLTQKELTHTNLSDAFFMWALFFLIIGTTISVFASGAFDLFQKSMRQLRILKKKNEPNSFTPLSQWFKKKPTYWFTIGGTLLLISIILAALA